MPTVQDVSLAKAIVSYDTSGAQTAGANSYTVIPNITDIGELGLVAEAKEKTNLADTQKRYGFGMQDAPDKALKGQLIPFQDTGDTFIAEYTQQQAFITQMKTKSATMIKIEWVDGETDEFLFQPLGYTVDAPNSAEWKMFSVQGKQNSEITNTPAVGA